MAVAGSSIQSIHLTIIDGKLHEGMQNNRSSSVVESNPEKAIEKLRQGLAVNLELYGNNLIRVRRAFAVDE